MCLILSRCCILQHPASKVYDRKKSYISIPHFLEVRLHFLIIMSLLSFPLQTFILHRLYFDKIHPLEILFTFIC